MHYQIRKAKETDLDSIAKIYKQARKFMADHENPTQWGTEYPSEQLLREDIARETLYVVQDEAGILSNILGRFAECRANIITINSIVPTNGCAVVTISAETMDLTISLEELLRVLRQTTGVIKAEILAG